MKILKYYRYTHILLTALLTTILFLSCSDLDSINPYDPLKNPLDPKYPDRYSIDIFNAPVQGIGYMDIICPDGIHKDSVILCKCINLRTTDLCKTTTCTINTFNTNSSTIDSCTTFLYKTNAWDKNGFVPEKIDQVFRIDFNVNMRGKKSLW